MDGEFRWMPQRSMYVLTISANNGMDHHFEADPKLLHTDDLWMQLLKEVADFLTDRGADMARVKTRMKDYADIYMSKSYDEIQQEQDRATGGSSSESADYERSGSSPAGESVPACAAPDSIESHSTSGATPVVWDNFPEANGSGTPVADAADRANPGTVAEPY